MIDQSNIVPLQSGPDTARITVLTVSSLENDSDLGHTPELAGERHGRKALAELEHRISINGCSGHADIAQGMEVFRNRQGRSVDRVNDCRDQVGFRDLVLVDGGQELGQVEAGQDKQRLAISDGKEMGPQGTKEMKHWQGHQPGDMVGGVILDCAVMGDDCMVRQDRRLGQTAGPAGREHGGGGVFGGGRVGEHEPVSFAIAKEMGEIEISCISTAHGEELGSGWESQLVPQEELGAVVECAFVHQADLGWMDVPASCDVEDGGEGITSG